VSHCPHCGKAVYRQIWTGETYDSTLSQNDCYLCRQLRAGR
jgi:hypothetical protein